MPFPYSISLVHPIPSYLVAQVHVSKEKERKRNLPQGWTRSYMDRNKINCSTDGNGQNPHSVMISAGLLHDVNIIRRNRYIKGMPKAVFLIMEVRS